jgi:hypothetical protein
MTDFEQGCHAPVWWPRRWTGCPIKPLIQKPQRMQGALAIDNNADDDTETPADASQITRESRMFAG